MQNGPLKYIGMVEFQKQPYDWNCVLEEVLKLWFLEVSISNYCWNRRKESFNRLH